jgi:hypothetical protein
VGLGRVGGNSCCNLVNATLDDVAQEYVLGLERALESARPHPNNAIRRSWTDERNRRNARKDQRTICRMS